MVSSTDAPALAPHSGFRWLQLVIGIVCMAMIANLQYGWTLFVDPIDAKYHWGRAAIQLAFTLFVVTETWLVPVEGYLVDRFGPRVVTVGGPGRCHTCPAARGSVPSVARPAATSGT